MLVKKLTNNNRKMTALAALGAVSAIGATTQVASADQTAAEQQAQSKLAVAIGRALEAKTSSEYRGVISNYKTAFDTALAHAESLTTSADVTAVNEAAIDLSNAIYDVNDPQNQQISSGAINEVSALANKLRQYQAYPDYDEFEDSVKNEINHAIEDAMNLAQNPSQGEYNRVKAEIKQASIDADMQIDLITKKHKNSSASSSNASLANSEASSTVSSASSANSNTSSNTSSMTSSNTSSSASNTSSSASSTSSSASNASSNTSNASSNTSSNHSITSSSASSTSSNTNSDANKSSDANAALSSVASNASNAFSSAIASIVSSDATNSQTASNADQSNASQDDQEISNDENTGNNENTPKNSLQNAIDELKRIKNSDTYKSLSPEEQKEIDNAISEGEALLNKQGVSDEERTKMAENLNTVSIKYMSTKWVDADGNELLKPEKGYHPDIDGKSDVSGYVFDHRALDKDGNMVNYYRKENQSENKTYYYDDKGHLIRDTIDGAHVDKGQSTISGYKLLGSYTLTDKDVSKGGDFYGIGMKAGDVINLYKKDTATGTDTSKVSSNASVADSSASSNEAGQSSASDSNASDSSNIASDADSNGQALNDDDSTTTDPGQEQPISKTAAVDVDGVSNNDNDPDSNGSADTDDDSGNNESADTNGTDDNSAPEAATNGDAATPADSGNADTKDQDGKITKTAQVNGQTPAGAGQTAVTNGSGSSTGTLPQTGSDNELSALLTTIGMLTATTGVAYMGVKKRKKA